jgi:beta-mannanase
MNLFKKTAVLLVVVTAVLMLTVLVFAGPALAQSATSQVKIGVYLPDPADLGSFEYQTDRSVEVYSYYHAINDSFYADGLRPLAESGHIILLSWEPWNRNADPVNQPAYRLRHISQGYYDDVIRRWARDLKAFQYPVFLRPMSEMNGDWTPWSGTVNGNSPADFAPAWRRIHYLFEQEGATNVSWVWSPNRDGSVADAVRTYDLYYPGDQYVDYVGLAGYNWGTMYHTPWWISSWQSFEQVFGDSYDVMTSRTDKPVIITETASTELGGNKAQWITDTFQMLPQRFPRVAIVTWFNVWKETDWRVQSSWNSQMAFRNAMWNLGPADTVNNYASFCPRPALTLDATTAYWADYPDYLDRYLTVVYNFRNFGSVDAYNMRLLGGSVTSNVTLVTPMPRWIGYIPAYGDTWLTLKYHVPVGVTSFHATNYAYGNNGCGINYIYPNT